MHQGALGDFLLALPVLEALHGFLPLIRMALWSKAEHIALLAEKSYVDSVHPPAEGELVPFFTTSSGKRHKSRDAYKTPKLS